MAKKYRIRLIDQERTDLQDIVVKGKGAAHKRRHAHILLLADESADGKGMKDEDIAATVFVTVRTVERVRKRCVEEGLEAALERREQKNRKKPVLDGEGEAKLAAIACSPPPEGHVRWTLSLLAEKLVEERQAN